MAKPKALTTQAGKGGAELPEMGALLRFLQERFLGIDSGAPVAAVAGVAATGTITIADNTKVTAGDTVTIGESTVTAVASDPEEGEFEIGANAGATRDNLLAALEAIAEAEGVAVAPSSTAAIAVTALAKGTAGNDIALAVELDTEGGITLSGAKLTGGVNQVLGTVAKAGTIQIGRATGKAYIAVKDTTETDTSGWKEITLS